MYDERAVLYRINNLCKKNRISYYELAQRANINLSTIMNIVNGAAVNPTIKTIYRISSGLGMTVQEFFDSKEFGIDFFLDED